MEMADYERLVKDLNGKLTEKEERGEELKAQINTLTQTQETHKQEIGTNRIFYFWFLSNESAFSFVWSDFIYKKRKWHIPPAA